MPKKTIDSINKKIKQFNLDRDWDKFHNPKDLAISLLLEAGEVLEHFQWKNEKRVQKHIAENKEEIADELADVFIYLMQLCNKTGVNILQAAEKKMVKNAKKYPIGSGTISGKWKKKKN